mmetsp:Transcript_16109/g.15537  ORF Transcript_16109/g.15537 Transcript_16109/m.15537 type:complete len:289 (-) Transcript_16109:190-1056(-)
MSESKIAGSVKWFSNKKGYGFITPDEGSSVTEDIFVHQSVIHSDGYRTLDEAWKVEFTLGEDEDGKIKAENVTAPGGGSCTGPRSTRRRRDGRRGNGTTEGEADGEDANPGDQVVEGAENADNETTGNRRGRGRNFREKGPRSPPQPFWHEILSEDVKSALSTKGIRHSTGTIDVAVGPARVKLGTRGYSSMVHADGILAEGSFTCDESGLTEFEWKSALKFVDEWVTMDDIPSLLSQLTLTDENVGSVSTDETPEELWGDGPTEPRTALETNGFQMRRVILTTRKRR